LFEQTLVEV